MKIEKIICGPEINYEILVGICIRKINDLVEIINQQQEQIEKLKIK